MLEGVAKQPDPLVSMITLCFCSLYFLFFGSCDGGGGEGGGLQNKVGLGLKPVYYTDGGEALKAAGRKSLRKASVNI